MSAKNSASGTQLAERWHTVRAMAAAVEAEAFVVGGGPDLSYLTGHDGLSYERLTALVALTEPGDSQPVLVTPKLEAERITPHPELFTIAGWEDSEDPIALVKAALPKSGQVLVSDDLLAVHLLGMQRAVPELTFLPLNQTVGGVRSLKNQSEREALRAVGALADKVISQLQNGEITLVGRTEAEVGQDISERLLAVGHETVEFVIVASGPNSASPHHHPGDRIIKTDEMVLFDFGGSYAGFNSDTTRCFFTGEIPADVEAAYDQLMKAQESAFKAAMPGQPIGGVDQAARQCLEDGGYGPEFIHRTGHGIGLEVHEHPYVTSTNTTPIAVGHAFSIEPGIYRVGQWGMRLEDIVVIEADGPVRCNNTDRSLTSLTSQ